MFFGSRERRTIIIRRSGMLRSYKIGSRPVNTFARVCCCCLARSCRVVEKFDKNHRFFMIFCDRVPRSERSDRISPHRGTISANGDLCLHRSVELCCHSGRILLKNSIIWLSGADRIGFLRNTVRSRQTEEMTPRNVLHFMLASL